MQCVKICTKLSYNIHLNLLNVTSVRQELKISADSRNTHQVFLSCQIFEDFLNLPTLAVCKDFSFGEKLWFCHLSFVNVVQSLEGSKDKPKALSEGSACLLCCSVEYFHLDILSIGAEFFYIYSSSV